MLDEEEEIYNVVEEREHNVGINDSIVDWYGVNFPSSITNTGEFKNRTGPVIQPIQNCDDCKTNSKTFDKQRELLMNQDKQIQQSHQIQKKKQGTGQTNDHQAKIDWKNSCSWVWLS